MHIGNKNTLKTIICILGISLARCSAVNQEADIEKDIELSEDQADLLVESAETKMPNQRDEAGMAISSNHSRELLNDHKESLRTADSFIATNQSAVETESCYGQVEVSTSISETTKIEATEPKISTSSKVEPGIPMNSNTLLPKKPKDNLVKRIYVNTISIYERPQNIKICKRIYAMFQELLNKIKNSYPVTKATHFICRRDSPKDSKIRLVRVIIIKEPVPTFAQLKNYE